MTRFVIPDGGTRIRVVLSFLLLAACDPPDPVHDRAVADLGDEVGAANEFHRAGQPCGTCHDSKFGGPANTDFSVAGTVYDSRDALAGAAGVRIDLVDSANTSPPSPITNAVGNFYIERSTWDPVFPIVSVKMTKDDSVVSMVSPIGGTASCATCHQAKASPSDPLTKVSAVYLP